MPPAFQPLERDVPTIVSGQRGPTDARTSVAVKPDVHDQLVMVRPRAAPFVVLTNKLRSAKPTTQWTAHWLEKDEMPRVARVSGAVTLGATTINVVAGQGTRVPVNGLLKNRTTREIVLVTAVSTDALTVVRSIGGINAATMDDGHELEILSTAHEDGAASQAAKSVVEAAEFNYCQIVRTATDFTGRQMNTDFFGGNDVSNERMWASIEHSKSLEKMYFFGHRATRTGANGKLQTMCGGLEYYIKSNVLDFNGNEPTLNAVDEWLEHAMKLGKGGTEDGEGKKVLFCSAKWLTRWDRFAKDRIQTVSQEEVFGLAVRRYISSHGEILITRSPALEGGEQSGYAFLVDLNHINRRPHQGRDTKLYKNRQNNDVDGEKDEYITDTTLQIELEFAHGLMKGIA
jgi:hypothetical protein